jgi:hypothetical protein
MIKLHDFGDRSTNVIDVFAVQRGHAHAASVCAIDAKLFAQAHHLVFAQAAVAEHADLRGDEAHVLLDAGSFELFNKRGAHGFDADTHFCEFIFPLLP